MSNRTRTRRTAILVLALASLPAATGAQHVGPSSASPPGGRPAAGAPQAAGRISGMVVNAQTGQPVEGASVAVRSVADSALVGGGFTRSDGVFRLDGLRPGRYTVRVRVIGYAPVVKTDVRVTPAVPAVDLGRLPLTPVATQLSNVMVTAERRDVTVAPDRTSYTVKDLPSASGGSAVDVLRTVPSIEVDGDNKLSLRGNENVVVQINGRISPMRGEQLGNFLAQLPATMVAKVEVVPNPSAKNDPEGMAGIVNIVLKENTELGTSGGLTLGGGTTGQVSASGNLGYQRGALTLFANYGFMRDERPVTGFTNRVGYASGLVPYLEGDISGANKSLSHSLNASADYQLGARDALSSSLVVSDRVPTRTNDNVYRELDADGALTAEYLRGKLMTGDELSLDYALAYKRTAARPGDGLSAELRLNRAQDTDDVLLTDQTLQTASSGASSAPALETNVTDERSHVWTLQADYTRTLAARTKLETGYKGTLRRMDNTFDVATSADGGLTYADDLTRSNAFDFDERVHAVYGLLSQGIGRFDLQAGLRAEQAATHFDLATTGQGYDTDYRSLYPSAVAAYNLDDARRVQLSYSKRVTRPDTRQLNPFGWREDALNMFQGNPALRPEYTHAVELGYRQTFPGGSLQVTPFVRHTVNAVRFIRTVSDAGVQTTTFQNVATSDSYGADVNGSLQLGRLTGFGGLSAFRQVTDGSNLSTDVSNDAFGWSARANATLKLTPTLDLQGFLMYRAPMNAEQGRVAARTMTNFALRQKLRGDQASVTLRVTDPFNAMKMGFVTDDGRFYQTSQRNFGARGAFLSFNYTFGQQPRTRPRGTEQADGAQAAPDGEPR
jgi:ferric enterobactin receptor